MRATKLLAVACAAGIVGLASSKAQAALATGAELSNAILSADVNGGPLGSAIAPTEGSYNPANSPTVQNTVVPDALGNTWTGWGGNTYAAGDGVQLPSSQSSPNVNATSISKAFGGGITATISIPGTAANYGQVNGTASLNSRDRGTPAADPNPSSNLGYMFRDFVFAGANSNVQSTNYVELQIGGLTTGSAYTLDVWSDDTGTAPTTTHSTNWTATPPTNTSNPGKLGWDPDPGDTFTAPPDEQTITWTGDVVPLPAAQFTLTADANGDITVYGWGGDGITGDQSADTTYLDGFQLAAAVPEPATIGLLGAAALGLLSRRRSH